MGQVVAYKRVVEVDRLTGEERDRLERELVEIPLASFEGVDRDIVAAHAVFRGSNTYLLLLYDAEDRLLGFCSSRTSLHRVAGRTHGVLDTGVFLRPGVRGGGAAVARSAVVQYLLFKRRHPLTPLCCISPATNPAIYRMTARAMSVVFPRRDVPVPAQVEALVREVTAARGLLPVGEGDPWLVRLPIAARIRHPERITRSERLDDDASRYFVERCPRWAQGECLMLYFSLTARDLAVGALRALRRG